MVRTRKRVNLTRGESRPAGYVSRITDVCERGAVAFVAPALLLPYFTRARSWSLFLNNEPHVVRDDDDAEGRSVDPK